MYCMIPDPFPSSAFGKGSATPDYHTCVTTGNAVRLAQQFVHRLSIVCVCVVAKEVK